MFDVKASEKSFGAYLLTLGRQYALTHGRRNYPAFGDDPPAGDPPAGDPPAVKKIEVIEEKDAQGRPVYKTPDGRRLLTQEHVNKEIGDARTKERKQVEGQIAKLEELQQQVTLSEQAKLAVQDQIENLRASVQTEKQRLEGEIEKTRREAKVTIDTLSQERDLAVQRWQSHTIETSLMKAAVNTQAIEPDQVISMLRSRAMLREITNDEGKGTGQHEVVVEVNVKGADGKQSAQTFPVDEALKAFAAQPESWNLFKPTLKPGVGGGQVSGAKLGLGQIRSLADYEAARPGITGISK